MGVLSARCNRQRLNAMQGQKLRQRRSSSCAAKDSLERPMVMPFALLPLMCTTLATALLILVAVAAASLVALLVIGQQARQIHAI